jgi:3',5'-cyclic AMP phosphodiesterase CpdA
MKFSFIHITDHHLSETESSLVHGFSPAHAFRAVMHHIAENVAPYADFLITTGDLVEPASEASYRTLVRMLDVQGDPAEAPGPLRVSMEGLHAFPMYFLPGNHDDRNEFFRCLFPKTPPMPLMNVVFVHKGIQFICLDWGPQSKAIAHPQTLDFLANSLQAGLPSIIMMHHHLVSIGSRWLDGFLLEEERFWEIVTRSNVIGIFCGHVHTTYDKIIEGIPVLGLRSTAFPFALQDEPLLCLLPPHYRFVTIQNDILTTRIIEVPL